MKKILFLILILIFMAGCGEEAFLEHEREKDVSVAESDNTDASDEVIEDSKEETPEPDIKEKPEENKETEENQEEPKKPEEPIPSALEDKDKENPEPIHYEKEKEPEYSDYSQYSNERRDWWFRRPKPLNQGIPSTIDEGIAKIAKEYNVIWQGDTGAKKVYITMDEGYEYNNNTERILDICKEKGVRIAFFITGEYIKSRPELVKRMVNEGHLVCNHTDKHLNGPKAAADPAVLIKDITDLEVRFRELIGSDILPFYRPPEGLYSERSLKIANDLGYTPVLWSFAYHDWDTKAQPNPEKALSQILGELHNGSVMLIHAVSNTNVEILPSLIDGIRERGYEIDTINNI